MNLKKPYDLQTAPTVRDYAFSVLRSGVIFLIISVAIAVSVTWYTTKGHDPQIHYQALRTATLLPMAIVTLCVGIIGFQGMETHRRMLDLTRLAHTDEMTGLTNRRAFMQQARDLFAATDLEYSGLCIFIVDLDHFKKVNDAYGHEAGDVVLIHASEQIVAALPDHSIVARLGGEEFSVILPYTNVAEIHQSAEAIRYHVASKPCAYNEHRIQVSASVGVGIAHPRDTVGSVMTRADDALYEAKNEGRNRFVVAA